MSPRRRLALIAGFGTVVLLTVWLRSAPGSDGSDPAPGDTSADAGSPPSEARSVGGASGADFPPRSPLELSAGGRHPAPDSSSGQLAGRVIDSRGARPIGGAELTFTRLGVGRSVHTDESGAFVFEPPELGSYVLARVEADGYRAFAPAFGHSPLVFVAEPHVRVTGSVIRLEPWLRILVRALDEDDQPIAGAHVQLIGNESQLPPRGVATSDHRGEAELDAFEGAVIEASGDGYISARGRVDLEAEISGRITLTLQSGDAEPRGEMTITGTIVDSNSEPIDLALVEARYEVERFAADAELHPVIRTTSNAAGEILLEGLDEGTYLLVARAEGHGMEIRSHVESGSHVELQLSSECRVSGHVEDADGQPMVAFAVIVEAELGSMETSLREVRAIHHARGRFSIGGLAAGPYRITIVAAGRGASETKRTSLSTGDTDVGRFRLGIGGTLSGTVTSGGRPLAGARVALEGNLADVSEMPLRSETRTDEEGQYTLLGIGAGLRSVTVMAPGHHARIRSGLMIEVGQTTRADIDLIPVAEDEEPHLQLVGIGAVLGAEGDTIVVGRVIAGGGAEAAGLQPGDIIVALDGVPITELGFGGSIQRIRGPEHSQVTLTIRRQATELTLEVTRLPLDA